MNRPHRRFTFRLMRPGRLLRLLLLALPMALGLAAGADGHRPALVQPDARSTVGTPRQSLPTPVHDEATCAFCQAAIFPPCAPQPTNVSVEPAGLVRIERIAVDAAAPPFTTHRPTRSRAPPTLRAV